MKYSFHLLSIIVIYLIFCTSLSLEWLTAVTSFLRMSPLYNTIRSKQLLQKSKSNRLLNSEQSKKEICHSISSSSYFFMQGYEPVVDMPRILLRSEIIEVYDVSTRESFLEEAFPCIVVSHSRDNTTALKFYISHEFDANALSFLDTYYIPARFIFVPENDKFYCEALAEEPATALASPEYNVEWLYLRTKYIHTTISKKESHDPLCRLNVEKKLRICSVVMNSSLFVNNLRFLPDGRNVKHKCEKRQVVIKKQNLGEEAGTLSIPLCEEWMMACIAVLKEGNTKVEYYLSRAYTSGKLFVYTLDQETGNMIPQNLSTRVRHIIDYDVKYFRRHLLSNKN